MSGGFCIYALHTRRKAHHNTLRNVRFHRLILDRFAGRSSICFGPVIPPDVTLRSRGRCWPATYPCRHSWRSVAYRAVTRFVSPFLPCELQVPLHQGVNFLLGVNQDFLPHAVKLCQRFTVVGTRRTLCGDQAFGENIFRRCRLVLGQILGHHAGDRLPVECLPIRSGFRTKQLLYAVLLSHQSMRRPSCCHTTCSRWSRSWGRLVRAINPCFAWTQMSAFGHEADSERKRDLMSVSSPTVEVHK